MKKTRIQLRSILIGIFMLAAIVSYSQISRANLINLNTAEQAITFNALANNEKLGLYIGKINELKTANYFSANEITFVDNLVSSVTAEMYSQTNAEAQFVSQKNYALTTLAWSELKWNVIFETIYTPAEFTQRFLSDNNDQVGAYSGDPGTVCHCRWSVVCPGSNTCDANAGCDKTVRGCGFLWLGQCEGLCTTNQSAGGNGFKGTGYTTTELRSQLGL